MAGLEDYRPVVGEGVIEELRVLGDRLADVRVVNVNSTRFGGGVAEILHRLVPLLNEVGVAATWEVMEGTEEFFDFTKKLHNALHGTPVTFTAADREVYLETIDANIRNLNLDADVHFIHDSQPAGLVWARQRLGGAWLWRCHVDVSEPAPHSWEFIAPMVEKYDVTIFSAPQFARVLANPQLLIPPSIDPLSDKNRELTESQIHEVLDRLGVHSDKPIIAQISRFDRLKDPLGVLAAWKMARERVDSQLILAGGTATDDPESEKVYQQVCEEANGDPDIHILNLPPTSNVEINAIQRASRVIVQKSIREGFGLTVSEALWKSKPVIAGATGGIPLQIKHKFSGILTHTVEGTAFWMKQLLSAPEFAKRLGDNGREHVRNNFLLTRHMRDYMLSFLYARDGNDSVIAL